MEGKKNKGRPTSYTSEIADEICDAIASSSQGLAHLCENNPHWPARQHIFVWLRKYPEFYDKYTRAKEQQVEVSVDYMTELMNEPHNFIDEKGRVRVDSGMLRTKMDAIKWQAGKLKPKKYGDFKPDDLQDKNSSLDQEIRERKRQMDEENKREY